MNKYFHQNIPLIALRQMPESFRDFLISGGFTESDLKKYADIPDEVDRDNLTQNSEIHHAHSYKLHEIDGKLKWIDGDCLERLKGLCADAHDFKAEGRLDMVRYCLAKMTHYRIDSLTYPHLHRGKPWSTHHQSFEDELGSFLSKHIDDIPKLAFKSYDDIYKACRATAIEMWHEGKEVVDLLESGKDLSYQQRISICIKAVQEVGNLWTTLANELKLA